MKFDELFKKEYKNKQILITGGLGFIGSNLTHRLVKYEADCIVFTKTKNKLRNVKDILSKIKIIEGNVTDYEKLNSLIKDVDFVFHLAAQTSNITSMENPFMDLEVNIKGTLNILEICKKVNPKVPIVSVGTVTQIGKPLYLPVDEKHPSFPLTIYDANKLTCEKYFSVYHKAFGLNTVFLRLATIFGEKQEINSPRTGILNSFIGKAMKKEKIKVFGEGKFLRDYVYIENVVDALLTAAITPKAYGDFFQIVTNRGIFFIDMVKAVIATVKEITKKEAEYENVPWPKEWKIVDVGDFVGSYEKFKEATGWYPRISFEEGLKHTVEFYSRHLLEYLNE